MQHDGRLVSPINHPDVAARLAELRAVARERSIVTIGTIVAKLEEAFEFAKANRNPSAMIQAAEGSSTVAVMACVHVSLQSALAVRAGLPP